MICLFTIVNKPQRFDFKINVKIKMSFYTQDYIPIKNLNQLKHIICSFLFQIISRNLKWNIIERNNDSLTWLLFNKLNKTKK